jgi:hypothetical protein
MSTEMRDFPYLIGDLGPVYMEAIELPGKASYSPRRDKQTLCLYGIELLGVCCMIAA